MLMQPSLSQLLVVDMQEKLVPAMEEADQAVRNCAILLNAAKLAEVPVTISEQYPQGLGRTVPALASETGVTPFAKVEFSCLRNEALRRQVESAGRKQLVVCGIEAHVCVLQTALEARAEGLDVYVVADAVASRKPHSKEIALDRLLGAGVTVVTAEMVVFEWVGTAGSKIFRPMSALIR